MDCWARVPVSRWSLNAIVLMIIRWNHFEIKLLEVQSEQPIPLTQMKSLNE
jgi:hypothetical protein